MASTPVAAPSFSDLRRIDEENADKEMPRTHLRMMGAGEEGGRGDEMAGIKVIPQA